MLTGEFPEQLKSLGSLATMTLYGMNCADAFPKNLEVLPAIGVN